ncbi:hypothetical protein ACODT5_28810 [Streptomyces sp. 5.8]|uniref:hypothetical protein n=1 Tax=Streptomyces sp. 5.8 TaxID=3406571 RepID=UPI003BB78619
MKEILQLKLGHLQESPLKPDPLGRRMMGWESGLDPHAVWERSRGVWPFNPKRAKAAGLVRFVNPDGIVVCVATVTDTEPYGPRLNILIGEVIADHPEIGLPTPDEWEGRPTYRYFPQP